MICVCQSEVSLQFRIFRIIIPAAVFFFAVFKKSSFTIQTDLEADSPRQAVFSRDKCYETMQGGTQSQVFKMFF